MDDVPGMAVVQETDRNDRHARDVVHVASLGEVDGARREVPDDPRLLEALAATPDEVRSMGALLRRHPLEGRLFEVAVLVGEEDVASLPEDSLDVDRGESVVVPGAQVDRA